MISYTPHPSKMRICQIILMSTKLKQLSFMRVFKERSKGDDNMETVFTSDTSVLEDTIDDKLYTTPE
jgi:hypothetical protein